MLIQAASELDDACGRLAADRYLAVDTEFIRESTYRPKLCLVQVANSNACAVFDPLALPTLEPLLNLLMDRNRVKILHAARQDLEVLTLAQGTTGAQVPGPIFDTQLAAGFLGLPAQIGYADLVQRRLGVTLDKGHTRTDWSRRPLTDEQLAYAADDVRYLGPLYEDLHTALERGGRLPWLEEEAALLENPELYRAHPEEAWKRFRGLEQLAPEQRASVKALAEWREREAVVHDRPRGWILQDETLRELAEQLPTTREALAQMRSLPQAVVRKHGDRLLALIADARDAAGAEPPAKRPVRPSPEAMAQVKQLLGRIRALAERLGVTPELLATRRDIEQLVYSGNPGVLGKGWRKDIVAAELLPGLQQS